MTTQLRLLDTGSTPRLSRKTIEVGRRGVQQARAALRAATRQHETEHDSEGASPRAA